MKAITNPILSKVYEATDAGYKDLKGKTRYTNLRSALGKFRKALSDETIYPPRIYRQLNDFCRIGTMGTVEGLSPIAAGLRLGDVLAAIRELVERDRAGLLSGEKKLTKNLSKDWSGLLKYRWSFNPDISTNFAETFDLGILPENISKVYEKNQAAWVEHQTSNKALILAGSEMLPDKGSVVVFGAAKVYDLPVDELARDFDKVVLVDIDGDALEKTKLAIDKKYRDKIETRIMDLTGISTYMQKETNRIIEASSSPESAHDQLVEFFNSYHLPEGVQFLNDGEYADMLVSGMVLTQITNSPVRYARGKFEKKFGVQHATTLNKKEFTHAYSRWVVQVQHDHIAALGQQAGLVVLTSEIGVYKTGMNHLGQIYAASDFLPMLGAMNLLDRVPSIYDVLKKNNWHWVRKIPIVEQKNDNKTPTQLGAELLVEGLILKPLTQQ